MTVSTLAVIGAGTAGRAAADEAASLGIAVHIFDRFEIDLHSTEDSNITLNPWTPVWGLFPDCQVCASRGDRSVVLQTDAVLLATGSIDLVVPCVGSTLPGVMAARGMSRLIADWGLLPGRRFVVVGGGPDAIWISDVIRNAGGEVVLTVDGSTARSMSIIGESGVSAVSVAGQVFAVDIVVMAAGSIPDLTLAAIAGCAMAFDEEQENWHLALDDLGRTSVPGIWAIDSLGDPASELQATARAVSRAIAGITENSGQLLVATGGTQQPWIPDPAIGSGVANDRR